MQIGQISEWTATFVESMVILSVVSAIAGQKQQGGTHTALTVLSAIVLTALTSLLNAFSAFSFLTPVVAAAFVILILARMLTEGTILLRSLACVFAYFVVLTVDYIILTIFGLALGVSDSAFSIIMTPGKLRTFFLIVDKSADVVLLLLFGRYLPKLGELKRNYRLALLGICVLSYVTVQYLFSTIINTSVEQIHTINLISWLYILFFFVVVVISFALLTKSEQEKQTQNLLAATNQLLAENYQQLHTRQQEYAKSVHDFKHHLAAINGLEARGKHAEVLSYIDSLLSTAYQEVALCHSGSDIIDAIINHKASEASMLGIAFIFSADFHTPTNIDPVDICGALTNQIDNAIEACRQMASTAIPEIRVKIYQRENFAIFRVENTVNSDPFKNNAALHSTKPDTTSPHGLGLRNIRDIAEKYNGTLRNEYKEGHFLSVLMLCFEQLNT